MALVTDGLVIGKKAGKAIITVTSVNNISFSCEVTVNDFSNLKPIVYLTFDSEDEVTTFGEAKLVNLNKTQDIIIIYSANGMKFTFMKGTMHMIDGKESYDFGVEIITDYNKAANSPFIKDEFAFQINYKYEGSLSSENTIISIPVDKKWIGQRLYYYQIGSNGEYSYLTSAAIDENGMYTITQKHCSSYIAALKLLLETPKKTESDKEKPSGKEDEPNTGDTDMTKVYIIFGLVAGVTELA